MFVFVDVETTGLRDERDELLEVGIALATPELQIRDFQSWVIRPPLDRALLMERMDDVVREMHTKNVLIDKCYSNEAVTFRTVEHDVRNFFAQHGIEKPPMCGSSVHFDRRFLARHIPGVEALFHYRNVDVSTLKNLFDVWAPEVAEGRPRGEKRHRALPDIQDTIAELAYYREHVGKLAR